MTIIFVVNSCAKVNRNIDTQVNCANGLTVVVLSTRARDLVNAIRTAYNTKKKEGTREKYTALRLDDKRSFFVKVPVEDLMDCVLEERYKTPVDFNYTVAK